MQALINHNLSPLLIPITDMKSTILNINAKLRKSNSELFVRDMSSHELYSDPKFHWTFTKSSLYITYYFPLSSSIPDLTLYKIHNIPVPLDNNSSHVTVLTNLRNYLALSNDQHYFTYFDNYPGSKHSNFIDASDTSVPLFSIAQSSCITALFFEHRQAVKELCQYKVKVNAIQPEIQHIENGRYLVVNTSELLLNCPSGRKRHDGCQFCMMKIPCQCDITTITTYFPPRLNDCYENEVSILHPVNLAVLMHLKELRELNHISVTAAYKEMPKSVMLDVKLFSHNFSQFVAQDADNTLSLKKVVDSVKQDKYVFRSLAEPILDQLFEKDNEFDYLSWNAIVMYVDTGVLFIVCVSLVYIVFRLNNMHANYIALATVAKAESLELFPTTPSTTNPTVHVVTEVDNRILYVLLTLAVITLIFIALKYLIRKVRHATLALEITDGHNCVVVPLIYVPYYPKFYHLQTDNNFKAFKVTGWLYPLLRWQANSLTISHLLDDTRLAIPQVVDLSWFTALKLRRSIRKPFYAYLICEHATHACYMNVRPPHCSSCQVVLSKGNSTHNKNSLYPSMIGYSSNRLC